MCTAVSEHLVEAAKSVGISGAVAQPVGEFVDAVLDEVKRQEYKDNGAKSRFARQHKALLVPDIRLPLRGGDRHQTERNETKRNHGPILAFRPPLMISPGDADERA